jgi:5'-methylthioadenosine phosphorylase
MDALTVGAIGGGLLPEQWGLPYKKIELETPFGKPSAAVAETHLGDGKTVYSILRHGECHGSGHAVNYLANVATLHSLGCDLVISLSLAGALVERFNVGDVVVYDDVLDFRKTSCSFYGPTEGVHCSMAPLVSPPLHEQLRTTTDELDVPFGATMVVIEGPRYSTQAESRMYVSLGGELICQTVVPECFLVREKQMDWFGVCLVTDRDTRDPEAMVSTGLIYENMNRHKERYAATVLRIIEGLSPYVRSQGIARHTVPRGELARYSDE